MTKQAPSKATRKPETVEFYRVTDENMQTIVEHAQGHRDTEIFIQNAEIPSTTKIIKVLVISGPTSAEYATRGDYVVVSNGTYRVLDGEEFHAEYVEDHKPVHRGPISAQTERGKWFGTGPAGAGPERFTGAKPAPDEPTPAETQEALEGLGFEFNDDNDKKRNQA
jgi:hypothetical protein